MSSDLKKYLKNIELLANCNLEEADPELLKDFKSFWELQDKKSQEHTDNYPLSVNLFVEDLKERKGPFPFLCMAKWTGQTIKEKIEESFFFCVEFQTLFVESILVKNNCTIESISSFKEDCALTVFIYKTSNHNLNHFNEK